MKAEENRVCLGVDLGGTNVRLGLVKDGEVIQFSSQRINATGSEEEVFKDITDLMDSLITPEAGGIGIGVPSVVDVEQGIVFDTLNIPSWKEIHLKAKLESRYNMPVFVNNDANCFVLGEKYFGKAKGCRNVAGMVIGTGLGAGIIANGTLYTGGHCGAGEFGVIPFRDKTLEDYVSGSFFRNRSGTPGEELAERATAGDAGALELFTEFGRNLGEAVKIVMYAIDPELIILGGSVSKAYPLFEKPLWESLADFAYQRAIRDLRIEVSETEQVALLGAAALCFEYSASSSQR